ncbi:hypothetical protein VTK73DRAFT_10109 [Phialemonium thermophilum]|uniref:Uncharacterized protein n=1 Tax=Phialemonium thermophilum TaxID=223376 RepID=A0ABR3XI52_9PEZI
MMLRRLAGVLLGLAELALLVRADKCTTFPTWTLKDFQSNGTDSVGGNGTASFTLENDLTGTSDDISCNLQVNYRCTIEGTPSDANLTITFEIRMISITFVLDEVLSCPGKTSPIHVVGNEDLPINCTQISEIGDTFACSLDEATIKGTPVDLAPDPLGPGDSEPPET